MHSVNLEVPSLKQVRSPGGQGSFFLRNEIKPNPYVCKMYQSSEKDHNTCHFQAYQHDEGKRAALGAQDTNEKGLCVANPGRVTSFSNEKPRCLLLQNQTPL